MQKASTQFMNRGFFISDHPGYPIIEFLQYYLPCQGRPLSRSSGTRKRGVSYPAEAPASCPAEAPASVKSNQAFANLFFRRASLLGSQLWGNG